MSGKLKIGKRTIFLRSLLQGVTKTKSNRPQATNSCPFLGSLLKGVTASSFYIDKQGMKRPVFEYDENRRVLVA